MLLLGIGISVKAEKAQIQEAQTKIKKTTSPTEIIPNSFNQYKKENGDKTKTKKNGVKHKHKHKHNHKHKKNKHKHKSHAKNKADKDMWFENKR